MLVLLFPLAGCKGDQNLRVASVSLVRTTLARGDDKLTSGHFGEGGQYHHHATTGFTSVDKGVASSS